MTCTAADCDNPALSLGLCKAHYQRQWYAKKYPPKPRQVKPAEPRQVKPAKPRPVQPARPVNYRQKNLWYMYRITQEEYDALRVAQDYRCAVCSIHEDDINLDSVGGRPRHDGAESHRNALVVDHCHDRLSIRGLLCPPCNKGLGGFRDDPALMRLAASYVELTPIRMIDRTRRRPLANAS